MEIPKMVPESLIKQFLAGNQQNAQTQPQGVSQQNPMESELLRMLAQGGLTFEQLYQMRRKNRGIIGGNDAYAKGLSQPAFPAVTALQNAKAQSPLSQFDIFGR